MTAVARRQNRRDRDSLTPAADEFAPRIGSLAGIDGMGGSQSLKPQIARYRNALIAAQMRGFAHPFRRRARPLRRPSRGHNGLMLIRP
jgi:hypothetical protein